MAKPKKKGQVVTAKAGASEVKECNCEHDFQDSRYGKGKRLKICQADGRWECTVCGRS